MIDGIQGTPLKTTSVRSEGENIEKSNGLLATNAKNTQDSITISKEGKTSGLDFLRTWGDRLEAYRMLSKDFRIYDEIDSVFEGYYTGKTSIEDITQKFNEVVQKVRDFEEKEGIASREDMEHFAEVVSDIHRRFKVSSVSAAYEANQQEGRELGKQYGTPGRKNFLYYNSDYYYQCEEINQAFSRQANEMLEGTGFLPNTGKPASVKKDIYENFNAYWRDFAVCSTRMGDMIDTDMEPPRGFTFFYKEDRYTEPERDALIAQQGAGSPHLFDGILKVSCGGWNTEGNVTLGYGPNAALGNNALELLNRFSEASDSRIARFLENFNIHQVFYSTDYLYRLGRIGQHAPQGNTEEI